MRVLFFRFCGPCFRGFQRVIMVQKHQRLIFSLSLLLTVNFSPFRYTDIFKIVNCFLILTIGSLTIMINPNEILIYFRFLFKKPYPFTSPTLTISTAKTVISKFHFDQAVEEHRFVSHERRPLISHHSVVNSWHSRQREIKARPFVRLNPSPFFPFQTTVTQVKQKNNVHCYLLLLKCLHVK